MSSSIGMAVVDSSNALTDRGQAFQAAAACTTVLLLVTLLALVLLGRIRGRAAVR